MNDKKSNIDRYVGFILIAALYIMPLELTRLAYGPLISKIAIIGVVVSSFVYLTIISYKMYTQKENYKAELKKILYYAGVFSLLCLLYFFKDGISSIKPIIWMFLIGNVAITAYLIGPKVFKENRYIIDIGNIIYILSIFGHLLSNEKPRLYEFIFVNSNYLGIVMLLLIYINLITYFVNNTKTNVLYSIILVYPMLLSRSRTSVMSLIVTMVIIFTWNILIKNKTIYNIILGMELMFTAFITVYIPTMFNLKIPSKIESFTHKVTNKTFYTGRELLWFDTISLIKKRPIIGYGIGTRLGDILENTNTSHSVYLQVLLEGGLVYLALFLLGIVCIWNMYYKNANKTISKVGSGIFLGILVMGIFELTLMGQVVPLSIIQWFMIGIGLSVNFIDKKEGREIGKTKCS